MEKTKSIDLLVFYLLDCLLVLSGIDLATARTVRTALTACLLMANDLWASRNEQIAAVPAHYPNPTPISRLPQDTKNTDLGISRTRSSIQNCRRYDHRTRNAKAWQSRHNYSRKGDEMRRESGQLVGSQEIKSDLDLLGQIVGNVEVKSNASLRIRGMVVGTVTIQPGARLVVDGMVVGDVINAGSLVVNGTGEIVGTLHTAQGQAEIAPTASIQHQEALPTKQLSD